jgi:hypothetical protein
MCRLRRDIECRLRMRTSDEDCVKKFEFLETVIKMLAKSIEIGIFLTIMTRD